MSVVGFSEGYGGFPELGKLRKGGPKQSNGQYGTDLKDYFRITSDDPAVQEQVNVIYGDKPNHIEVLLPYPDPDTQFTFWQESWNRGNQLVHRCDGVTTVKMLMPDGSYSFDPHPCPGGCRITGRLPVVLVKLARFASFMLETHGRNDCRHILSALRSIRAMAGDTPLTQVPLVVSRKTQEINAPKPNGETGTMRIKKSLIYLEIEPTWAAIRMTAMIMASSGISSAASAATVMEQIDEDDGGDWLDDEEEKDWPGESDSLPAPEDTDAAKRASVMLELKRLGIIMYGTDWQTNGTIVTSLESMGIDALMTLQFTFHAEWEIVGPEFKRFANEIDQWGATLFPTWDEVHRANQVKRLTKNRTEDLLDLSEEELKKLKAGLDTMDAKKKKALVSDAVEEGVSGVPE